MRTSGPVVGALCVFVVAGFLWRYVVRAEEAGGVPGPRITFHNDDDGVRGVKLRLYLKTQPDRAWELVTNSTKAAKLFKNVSSITASARGPRYSDYHLSSIIGEKIVTCLVTRDDAHRRLSWKRVDGSLVALYGYFKIDSDPHYPQHVRFEYGSYIDPGGIGRVLMTDRRRREAVQHMSSQLRAMLE